MKKDKEQLDISELDWKLKVAKEELEKTEVDLLRSQITNLVDKMNRNQKTLHRNLNTFVEIVEEHVLKIKLSNNGLRFMVVVNMVLLTSILSLLAKVVFF